jgi:hypothetical protein
MIALQADVMTLKTQTFLLPECDLTKIMSRIQMLKNKPDDTRQRLVDAGIDEEVQKDFAAMTLDAQQSEYEFRGIRTLLANTLTLAARAAPAAPQAPEHAGETFCDSPNVSQSDGIQFGCWVALLWIII